MCTHRSDLLCMACYEIDHYQQSDKAVTYWDCKLRSPAEDSMQTSTQITSIQGLHAICCQSHLCNEHWSLKNTRKSCADRCILSLYLLHCLLFRACCLLSSLPNTMSFWDIGVFLEAEIKVLRSNPERYKTYKTARANADNCTKLGWQSSWQHNTWVSSDSSHLQPA